MLKSLAPSIFALCLVALAPHGAQANQNGVDFVDLKRQLDQATTQSIEPILAGMLDDYCPFYFRRAIQQSESSDVFAVLFHPSLVNHLAEDTEERRAVWDAMADILENQYHYMKASISES